MRQYIFQMSNHVGPLDFQISLSLVSGLELGPYEAQGNGRDTAKSVGNGDMERGRERERKDREGGTGERRDDLREER